MARFKEKSDYTLIENRIKRHKKQKLMIIIGIVVVLAVISVCLVNAYINRVFDSYKVEKAIKDSVSSDATYLSYDENVLKVSRDGVSAYSPSGNILFNGSYDMRNPSADICDKYVAVADIGNYSVSVFDGSNSGKQITVTLPILQVQVARQGVVAILMEDKDTNVIRLYNSESSVNDVLVETLTNVDKNGFPVSIALSDDGKKLVTNYVTVKNGVINSSVTFYNFSEVGQNEVNRMVGARDYGNSIISNVEFIGNDTVCVYTDTGFDLFEMPEKNTEIATKKFDREIKSTFHTDSHIGFVLENDSSDKGDQVLVYNTKGKEVYAGNIDFDYDMVSMSGEEMIFISQSEGHIVKLNGVQKYKDTFETNVDAILPINNYNKYFLIDNNNVNIIKLTED
ncbi:MAG: DUF5711 family protein [bacterium]|nr:DUF5711 family protein [bacterium]